MSLRQAFSAMVLATVMACAARPLSAQAQPPPAATANPATPAIRDDVRKLYNDALEAFKHKDFEIAYKGFQQAWSLQKIPRIAGNLGRAELALHKHRDAAEHLALFLREDQGLGDEERSKVSQQLAEAKAKVGTLRVEATPAGAEVLLDGAAIGTSPLPHELYVDPGRHTVEVRHAGRGLTREIEARAGSEDTLKLDVPAVQQPPPKPPTPAPLVPPQSRSISIRTVLFVGGSVVAAAGLGVGIGTGAASLAKQGEQDGCLSKPPAVQRSCWEGSEPERQSLAVASTAGFIVAGAGLVTLGFLLISGGDKPAKSARDLRVTPAGTGVIISGTW